ncbi:unnamed protein product, partial [Musa textilis]
CVLTEHKILCLYVVKTIEQWLKLYLVTFNGLYYHELS